MEPGTPGTWDGEKWIPLDHEQLRAMVVDILIRDVSPVLDTTIFRGIVRDELASHLAAALADPNLADEACNHWNEGFDHDALRSASKALAGFLLERVTETKAEST